MSPAGRISCPVSFPASHWRRCCAGSEIFGAARPPIVRALPAVAYMLKANSSHRGVRWDTASARRAFRMASFSFSRERLPPVESSSITLTALSWLPCHSSTFDDRFGDPESDDTAPAFFLDGIFILLATAETALLSSSSTSTNLLRYLESVCKIRTLESDAHREDGGSLFFRRQQACDDRESTKEMKENETEKPSTSDGTSDANGTSHQCSACVSLLSSDRAFASMSSSGIARWIVEVGAP